MKKGLLLSFVVLLMALMMPLQSFSAPTGYKEVKITAKNFGTLFGTKKVKNKDEFGDYSGYSFLLTSKMLKKGYYIYAESKNFAVKCNFSLRYKYTYKDKGKKTTVNDIDKRSNIFTSMYGYSHGALPISNYLNSRTTKFDYKYAKALNYKAKKTKGSVVFIEPSNILGKEVVKEADGKFSYYKIKLKYPYDENTKKETKYNEETGQYDVLYYYCYCTKEGFRYS